MLLRRVMAHVRHQDWTAVGIDFVIVVVGVFIGLQVDDWNESRKDRADAKLYLERIHNEIELAEKASARVRERRLGLIDDLEDAARVIFGPDSNRPLTDDHCYAMATSHYFNVSILGLPALEELMSAGRLDILGDTNISGALIRYHQSASTLDGMIDRDTGKAWTLPVDFPELIQSTPVFDSELGEMQGSYSCDLEGLRRSRPFLNRLSENVDYYDAYLRDGLLPWSKELDSLHQLMDDRLGLSHEN